MGEEFKDVVEEMKTFRFSERAMTQYHYKEPDINE